MRRADHVVAQLDGEQASAKPAVLPDDLPRGVARLWSTLRVSPATCPHGLPWPPATTEHLRTLTYELFENALVRDRWQASSAADPLPDDALPTNAWLVAADIDTVTYLLDHQAPEPGLHCLSLARAAHERRDEALASFVIGSALRRAAGARTTQAIGPLPVAQANVLHPALEGLDVLGEGVWRWSVDGSAAQILWRTPHDYFAWVHSLDDEAITWTQPPRLHAFRARGLQPARGDWASLGLRPFAGRRNDGELDPTTAFAIGDMGGVNGWVVQPKGSPTTVWCAPDDRDRVRTFIEGHGGSVVSELRPDLQPVTGSYRWDLVRGTEQRP